MHDNKEYELYLIFFIGILLVTFLTGFILYFIVLYKNKQKLHLQEQENLHSMFRQEILKTQLEVQEQTLTNISREIHDNITQVLSFVKLNLGIIDLTDANVRSRISESRTLVAQVINDLRNLSKSLSFEHIAELGLVKVLEMESERINTSGFLKVTLIIDGEPYSLGEQRELVLFRIFQEALNNALKHANANRFNITLKYYSELFNLTLEDDGAGFSPGSKQHNNGSGLKNMQNRAALIGAVATIDSWPGKGCYINVTLNPISQLYTNGSHPNSPG